MPKLAFATCRYVRYTRNTFHHDLNGYWRDQNRTKKKEKKKDKALIRETAKSNTKLLNENLGKS